MVTAFNSIAAVSCLFDHVLSSLDHPNYSVTEAQLQTTEAAFASAAPHTSAGLFWELNPGHNSSVTGAQDQTEAASAAVAHASTGLLWSSHTSFSDRLLFKLVCINLLTMILAGHQLDSSMMVLGSLSIVYQT